MPKSNKTNVVEQHTEETDTQDTLDADEVRFVSVDDFDVNKLILPAIDDKRSSDTHYHAFPVYKYGKSDKSLDKLLLTTGDIKLTKGGIPKIDGKWRKTDADPARSTCWVGEDKTQPELEKFFNVCRSIDDKFDKLISYDTEEKRDPNLDTKTVFLNKDGKKESLTSLDYTPLVRLSQQGGEGDVKQEQKEYVPYERVKLRFAKKYDKERKEGEPQELTTVLFLGENEKEEDLKYPSEFEKYLRWNCTARFVLQLSKFRVKKAIEKDKKGKQLPRECAFDFNIVQVIITKEAPSAGMSNADKYRKRFFPPSIKSTSSEVTETKKETKNDSESSDESEDENQKQTEKPVEKKSEKKSETKQSKVKSESEDSQSEKSDDDKSESDSSESESEKKSKKTDKKEDKKEVKKEDKKSDKKEDKKSKSKKVDSESEKSESEDDSEDKSEDDSEDEKQKQKQKEKEKEKEKEVSKSKSKKSSR